MPFGEDVFAGIGGRTGDPGQKYSSNADDIRQKFTGYQKDSETSLDFAEARMYDNRHGRFTAVDPLLASGKSANPQTFNRYVYVGNSPLSITDPLGLDWFQRTVNGRMSYNWSNDNKTFSDGSAVEGWDAVNFNGQNSFEYSGCVNDDCSTTRTAILLRNSGGWFWSSVQDLANFFNTYSPYDPKQVAVRNPELARRGGDVMWMAVPFANAPSDTYNLGAWGFNKLGGNLPYAPTITPDENTSAAGKAFYYGANAASLVKGGISLFSGVKSLFSSTKNAVQFEQYSLRAVRDGLYPVYKRGFKDPVGEVFLKKGDVWKFGQTINGPARYPASFYTNTGAGLKFAGEFSTTSYKTVLQVEKFKILEYERIFRILPAGNKIRR